MPDIKPRHPTPPKKPDGASDSDGWLDRNQASDLLGCSIQTLANYQRRGRLKARRALRPDAQGIERQVYVYDPRELAKLHKHVRPVVMSPGEIAARTFELLDQGKSIREIVIEIREMPDTIVALKEQWSDLGGADRVLTPLAWDKLAALVGPFDNVGDLITRIETLVAKLAAAERLT